MCSSNSELLSTLESQGGAVLQSPSSSLALRGQGVATGASQACICIVKTFLGRATLFNRFLVLFHTESCAAIKGLVLSYPTPVQRSICEGWPVHPENGSHLC